MMSGLFKRSTAPSQGSRVGGADPSHTTSRLSRFLEWFRRNRSTVFLLGPLLLYMALVFAVPVGFQVAFAFFRRVLYKGRTLEDPAYLHPGELYTSLYRLELFYQPGLDGGG